MYFANEAKEKADLIREARVEEELKTAKNKIEKYINSAVDSGHTSTSVLLSFEWDETVTQIENWLCSFGYDLDWYHPSTTDHYLKIYWYDA